MARIVLVRHGETEANHRRHFAESDEIPLTDLGRSQAEEVAALLARDFRPSMLFSSSFARARETSEIIGRALGLESRILADIHERDFGCLRGLPYESFDALYDPLQSWNWRPEGGESLHDVRVRAITALESVCSRSGDRDVLVVCHGAVMRAVCAHISGDWTEMRVVGNCSIVVLEHTAQSWRQVSHPSQTLV